MRKIQKKYRPLLVVFVVCLLLQTIGCDERRLSSGNFDKLKDGMTKDEVIEIMGENEDAHWKNVRNDCPDEGITEELCDEWLRWGVEPDLAYVGFKDGKVVKRLVVEN